MVMRIKAVIVLRGRAPHRPVDCLLRSCHDVRANCIPAVRIHAGESPGRAHRREQTGAPKEQVLP